MTAIPVKDSTFEFERKRNRPERYDRNVTEMTLKAIKKIDKIRVTREVQHHKTRLVSAMSEITLPKIKVK
ncbi:hypothetical protein BHE74_00003133, partial [Ensete ventricosum]